MNNIQKSFKQKAKHGLRAFAGGGLLDSFNTRQQEWDAAASTGGGYNALPETPSVAQAMAEGAANSGIPQATAQSTLDGIVRNSNLSGRQKARAAMALNTDGALDTSGIRGLSANQNAALTVDQFNANAGIKRRSLRDDTLAFAGGGTVDPVEQMLANMKNKYGVGNQSQPAPAPQPVQQAPAPVPVPQPKPQGWLGGIRNALDPARRERAAGYEMGGVPNIGEYWAEDNAAFEKTNPSFGRRVMRAVNPMTGFGSAVGSMHSSASKGDVGGMALAAVQAIPSFGVMRAIPAAGLMKATIAPSVRHTVGTYGANAVAGASADEAGYEMGGVPHVGPGGYIHGQKGVDKVPAKIAETGEDILVSDGERIVNKKQNKALEHLAQKTTGQPLDDYLEGATGQPVGPKLKKGLRAAAGGFFNDVGDAMANMVKSPDRRAMDAGTATPEQVARENHGMQRAFATDSPYDVALPMTPVASLRAAAPKASGMVDSAMSAAKNAANSVASAASDAVRGLRSMVSKKSAAPAAEAVDNVAPIVAPEKWSTEAAEHLAQRAAQDKAFAAATTTGKAVPTAGKELAVAPAVNALAQTASGAPSTAAKPSAGAAGAAPATAAATANPEDNANIRSLRSAGVQGDVGGDDPRLTAKEDLSKGPQLRGIRTIDTPNGKVYAGRDTNGQLNVVSNLGQTAAEAEAARSKEAARINADLKRQTETFDKLALERDMKSNNPADRASAAQRIGLRQLDAQIAQANQQNETARRGQDLVLQGHQLDAQAKLATLVNQRRAARAENVMKQLDNEFGPAMLKDDVPNARRQKFESSLRDTLGEVGLDIGDMPPKDMQEFKKAFEMAERMEPSAARQFYMNWIQGRPFVRDFNPHRQVSRAKGDAGKTDATRLYQTANGWDAYAPAAVDGSFLTGAHDINARRYLDK